ncbi:SMC-Scp complex subunit ScpB, partial [Candidatus Micrarchaeota archaeon]|nr:SMC-Scp complex subunit ScpB [Candidatus Micrarchaeota archaeon]
EFSKATLRCLGLIAVKQPVRQSVVVKIIGNKAYDYIRELKEKGFLDIRKEANTRLLSVTHKFEDYFGKRAEEIRKGAVGV